VNLSDFDFELPDERIALHPASPRDASRLLVVRPGEADNGKGSGQLADHRFTDLPDLLNPGDLLVFNDTRVIPARLKGTRHRDDGQGGDNQVAIEALLVRALDDCTWEAFARPGKRLKPGDRIRFGSFNPVCLMGSLAAEVIEKGEGGLVTLRFDRTGAFLDEAIALVGAMPLPPYILDARRRAGETENADPDTTDYQTIFAAKDGAVAAPTASLHFTPGVMARLAARGVRHVFVTLHVGAGTFLPVKDDDLEAHKMHTEWGEVSAEAAAAINETRARGGRIVAVGTTACRLIETASEARSTASGPGATAPFSGETAIFIRPGYRFRATDALITNFHLPKSTLLMLVSAFAGVETMRAAYSHAISAGYRFYSYGDSSLLFPEKARA
jgi:S-adenosylmethionine:tRNA ribosyltransferase-isomerase